MDVEARLREKLVSALSPARLEIKNESHLHAGHAGAPAAGAENAGHSHFRILIVAAAFEGMSRVDRQRAVNAAVAEELAGPVHALAMKTLAPGEAE